jgi:hypothetical protein
MSHEGKALIAVAKAQGALLKATKALLKEDKHDGLRAAKWTARHEELFRELLDETESYGCADDSEIEAAKRAAGEPE